MQCLRTLVHNTYGKAAPKDVMLVFILFYFFNSLFISHSLFEFESLIQSTNVPAVKIHTYSLSLSLSLSVCFSIKKMLLKTFYFFLLLFIYRCLLDALRTGESFLQVESIQWRP